MAQNINIDQLMNEWMTDELQAPTQVWNSLEQRIKKEDEAFKGARISYASSETDIGKIWVASTNAGLCRVALPNESQGSFWNWLNRRFSGSRVREDDAFNRKAIDQLQAYINDDLKIFDIDCDVRGTPFQKDVLEQISKIPFGELVSYGDIAKNIGKPIARRAVGAATGSNPISLIIPCHRVVGADGRLVGYGGGLPLKERLLLMEGHHIEDRKLVPKSLFD
jgi:O-6-methylguanine DNA methyltransferase